MVFVVAALEVSEKIQTAGAIAGFAAILGLAVLAVLYFGQAREVKRLREWAGRAPERAAEMQDRVATDAQRRVVAQPVTQARPSAAQPVTPGAAAAGAAAKTAPAPMPSGGTAVKTPPAVGAPTLAGRTAPVPGASTEAKPAEAKPADAKPADAKPTDEDQPTVLQPPVPGAAAPGAAAPNAPAAKPPASTPAPATPAGGSGGAPATPAAAPPTGAPAPAPAGRPPAKPPASRPASSTPATAGAARPPAPAARPEPAVPLRSTRTSREASAGGPDTAPSASTSPAGATIAIVAAVAAILIAVILVVTGVIGGGDEPDKARNVIVPTAPEPGTPTTTTGGTAAAPLNRSNVSVVVLNGTATGGLAREAASKLGSDGYRLAASGNRGDVTIAKTTVYYTPGNERPARDIVKLLKVGTLARLDAGTEVVAKGFVKPTGASPAVVVTLGADAAQT